MRGGGITARWRDCVPAVDRCQESHRRAIARPHCRLGHALQAGQGETRPGEVLRPAELLRAHRRQYGRRSLSPCAPRRSAPSRVDTDSGRLWLFSSVRVFRVTLPCPPPPLSARVAEENGVMKPSPSVFTLDPPWDSRAGRATVPDMRAAQAPALSAAQHCSGSRPLSGSETALEGRPPQTQRRCLQMV